MPRVPIEPPRDTRRARVGGADARHLVKVLRLKEGDEVIAFDGEGREWPARIERATPTSVELALGPERVTKTESPCAILLGQGAGKGDKLETVVRAATELGVAEVVPVLTARAVAEGAGKTERLRRIAAEACKQCGRSRVPVVHPPEPLDAFLARAEACELKLVPWEGGGSPMRELRGPARSVALLVGPEGGLATEEVERAKSKGFRPVTLGPRILRTETAGIAAVAAVQLLLGDLS
jgi:16S rRNA (uracil1498-N3)-methyltransferase